MVLALVSSSVVFVLFLILVLFTSLSAAINCSVNQSTNQLINEKIIKCQMSLWLRITVSNHHSFNGLTSVQSINYVYSDVSYSD